MPKYCVFLDLNKIRKWLGGCHTNNHLCFIACVNRSTEVNVLRTFSKNRLTDTVFARPTSKNNCIKNNFKFFISSWIQTNFIIKIVDLNVIYKFIVFYLKLFRAQKFVLSFQIMKFKILNFEITSDVVIIYTKVVVLNTIYIFIVDKFFIKVV